MRAKAFLLKAAKWVFYPCFYGFALVVCFYLTFPWDSLKNRIISEFAKSQVSKGDKAWRLQIDQMSGYWFTGVELDNAKIIMPASDDAKDEAAARKAPAPTADDAPFDGKTDGSSKDGAKKDDAKAAAPAESSIVISKAHARVQLLPLLIGRVRVDFEVDAFGGDVKGTIPIGSGTVAVDIENVDLGQVAPIRDLVSLPLKGVANGKLELTSDANGKWAKSNGALTLAVKDVVLGDGKAKFMKQATLPPASLGTLEINGKTTDGLLRFDKFEAKGKDVQVIGQGSLRLRDPWDSSQLDLVLRFGFSDAYKVKDDKTIALFGDPKDPTSLPLIDFEPKMKQAKRPDGMWGFRGKGALKALQWTPTRDDGPATKPGGGGPTEADTEGPAAPVAQNPVAMPRPMIPGPNRLKPGVSEGLRAAPQAAERPPAEPQPGPTQPEAPPVQPTQPVAVSPGQEAAPTPQMPQIPPQFPVMPLPQPVPQSPPQEERQEMAPPAPPP